MQENEFEKQVKDMMDDFKINPSDAAWTNVSRRIQADKRRKRFFFFLLLAGLITAGYFGFNAQHTSNKIASTVNEKNADNKQQNNVSQPAIKDSNNNAVDQTELSKQSTTANNIQKDNSTAPIKTITNSTKNTIFKKQSSAQKNNAYYSMLHKTDEPVSATINQSSTTNKDVAANNVIDQIIAQQKTPVDSINNQQSIAINNSSPVTNNVVIDSSNHIKQQDSVASKQKENVAIANGNNNIKKKNNSSYKIPVWQFGVTAGYGISSLVEGSINTEKSVTASLSNSPGTTANYGSSTRPSKIFTSSDAYQFGITAQRKISKNSVIGIGANYLHLSVKNGVGKPVDSGAVYAQSMTGLNVYTVSRYYRSGSTSRFVNKYDFIEVPVYFQQDIFHAKKITVAYNAGFSIRQLINDKALVFDHFNNVYYTDDNLLRKTQFQVSGGLNFKFNTGKTNSIYIGPQFSYSLSNLVNDKSKGNFHFMNYGLQAGFLFHKK